jgi:hypothetical protein
VAPLGVLLAPLVLSPVIFLWYLWRLRLDQSTRDITVFSSIFPAFPLCTKQKVLCIMAVLMRNLAKGEVFSVIPFLNAVISRPLWGKTWRHSGLHSDRRRNVVVSPYTWDKAAISAMAPHPFSIGEKSEHQRQRGKSWRLFFGTGRGPFSSISCLEETL